MKNCRDCVHYSQDKPEAPGGECRRKAPSLAAPGSLYATNDAAPYGYWPIVQASQWCGEFRDKARRRV